MTELSLLPKAAAAAGINFRATCASEWSTWPWNGRNKKQMFHWLFNENQKIAASADASILLDVKMRTSQSPRGAHAAGGGWVQRCVPARCRLLCRHGARRPMVAGQLVYKNDAFAIQKIEVQTDGVLAKRQSAAGRWSRPGKISWRWI